MNKAIDLTGRVLFALPMLVFGLGHLGKNAQAMAGMVPSYVPGGVFWVYFTGVALIAAAVSLIWGKLGQWAGVGLAALLLLFALTIHLPGMSSADAMAKQMSFIGFLKDLALAGGALFLAARFSPTRS